MAFIPTPNAVRASVLGNVDSQLCVTTLWFLGAAPADVAGMTVLGNQIISWLTTDVLPILSNGYTVENVNLLAQDSDFAPSVTLATGLPATGAVNSPTQAPQVAGVVSFRTANRGRSARGRNYVPGVPESGLSSPGQMSTTFINALAAAYANLNVSIAGSGYSHVVVSHFTDHHPRTAGFPQSVLNYIVDKPLDTQRRRSVGRGV